MKNQKKRLIEPGLNGSVSINLSGNQLTTMFVFAMVVVPLFFGIAVSCLAREAEIKYPPPSVSFVTTGSHCWSRLHFRGRYYYDSVEDDEVNFVDDTGVSQGANNTLIAARIEAERIKERDLLKSLKSKGN